MCFKNLIYTSWQKADIIQWTRQLKKPLSFQTQGMTMTTWTSSIYQVTEEGQVERIPTPGGTDTTQPFEPGAASTPAGEHIPMSTRLPQEQQGSRTAETSFITGDTQGRRVITKEEMAWSEAHWPTEKPLMCSTRWHPEQEEAVAAL